MQDYYLSSLESKLLEPVRKCRVVKKIMFDTGKECAIAEIEPPIIGQYFNESEDIKYVLLANRHMGSSLFPVNEFPCFVFIAKFIDLNMLENSSFTKADVQIMAWGELYRSKYDAEHHIFD